MRIGELARQTGISTKTIRFYEEIGVLPRPERAPNGYRAYGPDAVDRLLFVRDAQAAGLSLTEIAAILEHRSKGESTCEHVLELLERHLEELDRHIVSLKKTRRQVAALAERARNLDPADCTDPIRCQTISGVATTPSLGRKTSTEIHAPRHHHHHT
jgi:DNA-binding transcriptional MerR regulator